MLADLHWGKAKAIEISLAKLDESSDGEVIVESVMIAVTHYFNCALHRLVGSTVDQRHADKPALEVDLTGPLKPLAVGLRRIEEIREACVRGGEVCEPEHVRETLALLLYSKELLGGLEF